MLWLLSKRVHQYHVPVAWLAITRKVLKGLTLAIADYRDKTPMIQVEGLPKATPQMYLTNLKGAETNLVTKATAMALDPPLWRPHYLYHRNFHNSVPLGELDL